MNTSNVSKNRLVTSTTKTSIIELGGAKKVISRNQAVISGAKTIEVLPQNAKVIAFSKTDE